MIDHKHEPSKSRSFSIAFEQMCSIVAIAETRSADETLRQLVLQCFAILPNERFYDERQLVEALDVLFGLQIPEHEVRLALDILLKEELVQRPANTNLALSPEIQMDLQKRIAEAQMLEEKVREGWLEEISRRYPTLHLDDMWKALRGYLARAFRRHGVQTTALLAPSVEVEPEYSESLSFLLDDVLKDTASEHQALARAAISSFFVMGAKYPDRAKYIVQLANGAFNYFSLTVAPDVAEQFRRDLSSLTLFFDTNFLFGILDLDVNSQVAVSNDLLRAIEEYRLPFEMRYHRRTEEELRHSIIHYSEQLRSRPWPISISRAAVTSPYISGVELRYLQRHVETGIDVDSFFAPYDHVDILLNQKSISKYNPSTDRTYERATLFCEYQEFLKLKHKNKPDKLIDHDTTVLDAVREMRSSANSSLEAGALLITCDYSLYKFDWESSQREGRYACTVLPNLFWQILRPFIPADADFDRSFAETFAIPEFRTVGSDSSRASSKMLYLLAAYKDFPEETASRLLSNDLLIKRLRTAKDDTVFEQYVEAAIVAENELLLEEKAVLAEQLEHERIDRKAKEEELEAERAQSESQRAAAEMAHREQAEALERAHIDEKLQAERALAQAEMEKQAKENAEQRATNAEKAATEAKARLDLLIGIARALVSGAILIVALELIVYKLPWSWLVNHQNSYGIQASFGLMLILGLLGFFVPKWRTWCWGLGVAPIIAVILQLLGGPRPTIP